MSFLLMISIGVFGFGIPLPEISIMAQLLSLGNLCLRAIIERRQ